MSKRLRPGSFVALFWVIIFTLVMTPEIALAQLPVIGAQAPSGSDLFLESDELIYDQAHELITAKGSVVVKFNGYQVEADTIVYNASSGAVSVPNEVSVIYPNGSSAILTNAEISNQFKEMISGVFAYVSSNREYWNGSAVSVSPERLELDEVEFSRCKPCDEKEGERIWAFYAKKATHDRVKHRIRLEGARLKIFGIPVFATPTFEVDDYSVKRSTGFLTPGLGYSEKTGFMASFPYNVALAPNYDLLLVPKISEQGNIMDVTWRHLTSIGRYDIRGAFTKVNNPDKFAYRGDEDGYRYMLYSRGTFRPISNLTIDWEYLKSSDPAFMEDYLLDQADIHPRLAWRYTQKNWRIDGNITNYEGIHDVGDSLSQPVILPQNKFTYYHSSLAGLGAIEVNLEHFILSRERSSVGRFNRNCSISPNPDDCIIYTVGTQLETLYASVDWHRDFVLTGGHLISLQAGTSAYFTQGDPSRHSDLDYFEADDLMTFRLSGYGGFTYQYPLIASLAEGYQKISPTYMLLFRPNEEHAGDHVNENARSVILDESLLFQTNRFSGTDRMEGGLNETIGLEYQLSPGYGFFARAFAGYTRLVSGQNSFTLPDPYHVGALSGLEERFSDIVVSAEVSKTSLFNTKLAARLEPETFEIRKLQGSASVYLNPFNISGSYFYSPEESYQLGDSELTSAHFSAPINLATYNASWRATSFLTLNMSVRQNFRLEDRQIYLKTVGGSLFHGNWRINGSVGYYTDAEDIETISLAYIYNDDCFLWNSSITRTYPRASDKDQTVDTTYTIGFELKPVVQNSLSLDF